MSLRILENNQVKLASETSNKTNVSKNTDIQETTENSIFKSKLTEEQKNKFDSIYDNVKRRLENE